MITPPSGRCRWKWCTVAILPVLLLSLLPQIEFWVDRGTQWQGAYATFNADEFLYSAYLNALIDGRPRRNDPFSGKDDFAGNPLPETAFSIQLIPARALWLVARVTGFTASGTFIVLTALAAVLTAAALFWLLFSVTSDARLSAIGTLFVLVAGTLCAAQGLIGVVLRLDIVALGLPFLRRYQPAASLFLFFVFAGFVWQAFVHIELCRRRVAAVLAGLCLGLLVFSYLYLWTTAVAWFGVMSLLWFVLRSRQDRRRVVETFAIIIGFFLCSLVPYAQLLGHRSPTLDELQTLIATHRVDLFRIPEIVGTCVLALIIAGVTRGRLQKHDPRVTVAASFAVLPLIVFNQQVLTGRSMQPFHFEAFVVNYAVLVSLVILATFLKLSMRSIIWVGIGCILLGATEMHLTRAFAPSDIARDQMVPVFRRLRELSNGYTNEQNRPLVFSPHFELNRILPTWAPQGTFLGIGGIDFGSSTHQERKEFLFSQLYYVGTSPDQLRELIRGKQDELAFSYYVRYVIFGHERVRPAFSLHFTPITSTEIEEEIANYKSFVESFSPSEAQRRPIAFMVIASTTNFEFERIDKWYVRDTGESIGLYKLYRLKPRN